ncbi:EAL and HDOD domain-containing protein [Janthinobacterium agaricidamnosum]|uniref:EAL domain protein n=1 Tax=Janthinobacterium agaricidamnosum NBRC 102515 = DSM 9628 TaxID=1349767 RepID=W0V2Z6_9BURK|nr:EAL domain-containing protein [Janthinobacterium agaricidamnosum]CDG82251.1 EAL domain protein [Janthinobacterium agaricidamnosum NBRC 102515 = DSM 9628]
MTFDVFPAAPDAPPLFNQFFLARQPILDREQRLVAYELLFRTAQTDHADVSDDMAATAAVIAHASELGMEQVVGQQVAYINVDAAVLHSDFIEFLPHDRVILEILETVRATPEVLVRMRALRRLGFHFALDDVASASDDVQKLLPLVDIVKVDLRQVAPETLDTLASVLAASGKKLLAEKVETLDEFQRCLQLGFEFFQGYYFARPVILTGKKISPSALAILHLLELIQQGADNRELEHCIKHDALIGLNLLRLVNTPAVGAGLRIDTLGQALLVLGRRQLRRWLQILLYVHPGSSQPFATPLLQLATTRGKLLELMTEKLRPGEKLSADIGFTVGIMSLMDALFSMSMNDVVRSVNIDDRVKSALLFRHGDFGGMLRLVEHVEQAECGPGLLSLLDQLQLSAADLNLIQVAAFDWVHGYVAGVAGMDDPAGAVH